MTRRLWIGKSRLRWRFSKLYAALARAVMRVANPEAAQVAVPSDVLNLHVPEAEGSAQHLVPSTPWDACAGLDSCLFQFGVEEAAAVPGDTCHVYYIEGGCFRLSAP